MHRVYVYVHEYVCIYVYYNCIHSNFKLLVVLLVAPPSVVVPSVVVPSVVIPVGDMQSHQV